MTSIETQFTLRITITELEIKNMIKNIFSLILTYLLAIFSGSKKFNYQYELSVQVSLKWCSNNRVKLAFFLNKIQSIGQLHAPHWTDERLI